MNFYFGCGSLRIKGSPLMPSFLSSMESSIIHTQTLQERNCKYTRLFNSNRQTACKFYLHEGILNDHDKKNAIPGNMSDGSMWKRLKCLNTTKGSTNQICIAFTCAMRPKWPLDLVLSQAWLGAGGAVVSVVPCKYYEFLMIGVLSLV